MLEICREYRRLRYDQGDRGINPSTAIPAELVEEARRLREHILDRWYRFEDYGVESRAQLEPIVVSVSIVERTAAPEWFDVAAKGIDTVIDVKGTPLEGMDPLGYFIK